MTRKSFTLALVVLLGWHSPGRAASPVTVTIDPGNAGAAIPPDFNGLSFETSQALPGDDGKHYFSIDENKPLVTFYRTLGIKDLRIGGNQADRPTVNIPNNSDIDSLFKFANAAGLKVIYTVRLKAGDIQDDIRIVKYIADHYQANLDCIAIGNEPDDYGNGYTYDKYAADWKRFMTAIVAAVPNAMFCGPCTAPGKTDWVTHFAADMGPTGHVAFAAHHFYSGGNGKKTTDAAAGRAKILSPDMLKTYQAFSDKFVPAVEAQHLKVRLEETNSFNNGGAPDVSDSFASALWGLDYLYWWAERGAAGINLHSGDDISAMQRAKPTIYTPYVTGSDGFEPHPLAYGIKAFDVGSHGRLVAPQIANTGNVDLTVHAVLGDDKSLYVTLINKEQTPGHDATVTIAPGQGFAQPSSMSLTAPACDVAAKTGITLGGAPINGDGTWSPTWDRKSIDSTATSLGEEFTVTVPAASAMIVKLLPN